MERIVLDANCLVQSISPRSTYRKVWTNYQLSPEILKLTLKNRKLVSDSIEDSLEDSLEEKYR